MDRRIVLALIVVAAVLVTAVPLPAQQLERGTPVAVGGKVLDSSRSSLGGVTILFEASKRSKRKKQEEEPTDKVTLPVQANEDGTFAFEWRWDPYYNTFHLAVALPIRQEAHQSFEVLHRVDISDALVLGGIVEQELIVGESAGLVWLRRFLGEEASESERRIFQEMGRPDRYDAAKEEGGESAWWYFTAGKVYWFQDGELVQVVPFDSIEPMP